MGYKYRYFDPDEGNDGTGDGTEEHPWQTLDKAATESASPDIAVNCLKKGGVFPFTGAGTYAIQPSIAGTSSEPVIWQSYGTGDRPVVVAGLEATGWTRMNDRANVYYKTGFSDVPSRLFLVGCFGMPIEMWKTTIGLGTPTVYYDTIPVDGQEFGWYYDSTAQILYICVPGGNPAYSGYRIFYEIDASHEGVIKLAATTGDYHLFQDIDFVGGSNYPIHQNSAKIWLYRNKLIANGHDTPNLYLLAGTNAKKATVTHNLIYGSYGNTIFGLIRVASEAVSHVVCNNLFYGGIRSIYFSGRVGVSASDPFLLYNNVFLDPVNCVFQGNVGKYHINADCNYYGVHANRYPTYWVGTNYFTAPALHDVCHAFSATASDLLYTSDDFEELVRLTCDFNRNIVGRGAGYTDRSPYDLDSNLITGKNDIGPYKLSYQINNHNMEINMEYGHTTLTARGY